MVHRSGWCTFQKKKKRSDWYKDTVDIEESVLWASDNVSHKDLVSWSDKCEPPNSDFSM